RRAPLRLRVPGGARHRLQHLPDDARERGGPRPRHPRRGAARPHHHRRGHHLGRRGSRRHLRRAGGDPHPVAGADRLHRGVRRAARHLRGALAARARPRLRPRQRRAVAFQAVAPAGLGWLEQLKHDRPRHPRPEPTPHAPLPEEPRLAEATRPSEQRVRRDLLTSPAATRVAFVVIILFVTAQMTWWIYFQVGYVGEVNAATIASLERESRVIDALLAAGATDQALTLLEDQPNLRLDASGRATEVDQAALDAFLASQRSVVRMLAFEGPFFVLVVMTGLLIIA